MKQSKSKEPADLSEGALAWLTALATRHPQSNAAELLRWVQAKRGAPHV